MSESNIQVNYFEYGVNCSSNFASINYMKNTALAIEFKEENLNSAVYTINEKDIEPILFRKTGTPLSERNYYYKSNSGRNEVQIQLQNAKVFMSNAQALKFTELVDAFHQAYLNVKK